MPVYLEHTSFLQATVMRFVVCEDCESEYVYELEIEGSGLANSTIFYSGSAPDKAKKQARDEFNEQKKFKCRALPCPNCGYFQDHMIYQAKRDRSGIYFLIGFIVAFAFLILGFGLMSMPEYRSFGTKVCFLAVAIGGGIAGIGGILFATYEPNKLPEETRLEMADKGSILRKDFEESFQEKYTEEYQKICKKIDQGKNTKLRIEGEFFADREQVDQECRLKATLPTGEPIRVELRRKMKKGERFRYEQVYKGHTIEFDYRLFIYTETRKR
jgi:hypothetical protein